MLGSILLAALAAAGELPLKHVVLYKNGVGYFERAGQVPAGQAVQLWFKAAEMNDVLKSLIVEDRAGQVTGLRYDSSEPPQQRLHEYPFRLGQGQPLAQFLDDLKGARIELKMPSGTVSGAIVGGRVVAGSEEHPEQQLVTLLADSGELQTFDLGAAAGLRLADPHLQAQLREYLAILSQGRSTERKSLTIEAASNTGRQIRASYIIPAAVWRSSYRLIFRSAAEPTIEGWAIVNNTTGEDWNGIQLALVSGRPTSFVSRLYEPVWRQRPTVELPEERVQGPVLHQGAVAEAAAAGALVGTAGGGAERERGKAVREASPSSAPAPMLMRADVASSIAAVAETRDLGELFEYRFSSPVTIRKGESAMLPFLQQQIRARKLLVYSESQGQNPMYAAEIFNSTGKTLDGGPITIFEAGAYSGETLMETLKAGDKRLISYAADLGSRVTTLFDSAGQEVREVHLRRGVLSTRQVQRETKTYTARNIDQRAKTLVVEHPVRPAYKVLSPTPVETTASLYRFELALAPGGVGKLTVIEERVDETSYAVTSLSDQALLIYARNKNLTEAARAQLEKIAALRKTASETDRAIARTQKEISE